MSLQEKLNAASLLKEDNHVAVLGPSGVGKTVFITLLNHAMDNYFLDKHSDLKSYVKSGRPFLEMSETSMLKGDFPERTQQLSRDMIVIEMSSTGGTSTQLEVKFPDISGEDYKNMCLGEEIRDEDRVMKVFDMGKPKGAPIGHMGYVVYAKMYVFLVDCSKFDEWQNLQTQYTQALTTILDFKKVSKTDRNGKIDTPIAIVLTKADQLKDRSKSAEDIFKNNMKRFYHTLEAIQNNERGFFSVYVDVQRNSNNEIEKAEGAKVAIPLTYSHEEYVRFIEWLHQHI